MGNVRANVELLKAMDTVVSFMNDEMAMGPWLMTGVPDDADEDDFEFIASDDELMDVACACFGMVMREYSKAGWFTNHGGEPPFVAYGDAE